MTFGEAYKILESIDSEKYTVEEKGVAIRIILDMETHNGITKTLLLKGLDWLWNEHFEIIQGGAAHDMPDHVPVLGSEVKR